MNKSIKTTLRNITTLLTLFPLIAFASYSTYTYRYNLPQGETTHVTFQVSDARFPDVHVSRGQDFLCDYTIQNQYPIITQSSLQRFALESTPPPACMSTFAVPTFIAPFNLEVFRLKSDWRYSFNPLYYKRLTHVVVTGIVSTTETETIFTASVSHYSGESRYGNITINSRGVVTRADFGSEGSLELTSSFTNSNPAQTSCQLQYSSRQNMSQ